MKAAFGLVCLALSSAAQAGPTFTEVGQIFADKCMRCHEGASAPLGLDLSSHDAALAGGWGGPVLVAGDAASPLLRRIRGETLPQMPLSAPPLTAAEIAQVTDWVMAGMPKGDVAPHLPPSRPRPAPGADVFWPDVAPILDRACVKCHSEAGKLKAPPEGLVLSGRDAVLRGGERLVVLPGDPQMSELWRRVTGVAEKRMPLDGPPYLAEDDIRLITDWIAQGARDADGQPAAIPAGAEIRLRGQVTGLDEIDGAGFVVTGGTRVDDRPSIGNAAEMRGRVRADGTVEATRLRGR